MFHCNRLSISSRFRDIGPWTYWGHDLDLSIYVTSSITWRFDSPYGVSYWCSIGTKSLSPSVFEIFGSRLHVQCKSSLRMRDITWPVPPMQNLGTYLNFPPPHCLFTMTLLLGSDEEGVFTRETPNFKREIERKFSKSRPKLGKFWRFWRSEGQGF